MDAAKRTVTIAFWGIIFSLQVGEICSVIRCYRAPVFHGVIAVYGEAADPDALVAEGGAAEETLPFPRFPI